MKSLSDWLVISFVLVIVSVAQNEYVFLSVVLKTIDSRMAVVKDVVVADMPMYIQDSLPGLELRKLFWRDWHIVSYGNVWTQHAMNSLHFLFCRFRVFT